MYRYIRSLGDVKGLLHMHGHSRERTVRLKCLWRIRHARKMRTLLRQQIDDIGWEVKGIEHLNALVRVHRRIAAAAPLLDQIISEFELEAAGYVSGSSEDDDIIGAAPARAVVPPAYTVVPWSDIVRLAEQMMEAGTGLPHQPVPPNLVDLAGRVLHDQAHPHEDGTAEDYGGGLELPPHRPPTRCRDEAAAPAPRQRRHRGDRASARGVARGCRHGDHHGAAPTPYDDGLPSPSQVAAGPASHAGRTCPRRPQLARPGPKQDDGTAGADIIGGVGDVVAAADAVVHNRPAGHHCRGGLLVHQYASCAYVRVMAPAAAVVLWVATDCAAALAMSLVPGGVVLAAVLANSKLKRHGGAAPRKSSSLSDADTNPDHESKPTQET
uniref:Uncharacterized protein n=1 Tax=Oryza punctata TaxID=4537 RepID=A0A0E0K376_ORYPU